MPHHREVHAALRVHSVLGRAVAGLGVLRRNVAPNRVVQVAVAPADRRPTSVVADLEAADLEAHPEAGDLADRLTSVVPVVPTAPVAVLMDQADLTSVDPADQTSADPADQTSVDLVAQGDRAGQTSVDPATSADPTGTSGVRRGTPVTTIGAGASTGHRGAMAPRRGVGVHPHRRRGTDRCRPHGVRRRRQSTTGASSSSRSGIRATTSGASTSSGSGFHLQSNLSRT